MQEKCKCNYSRRLTGICLATGAVVDGESIGAGADVRSDCITADLRARTGMQSALVYVSAKKRVFGVGLVSFVALALKTDRLVDAGVGARVDGLAFVDV